MSKSTKRALVLSGGGGRGAYHVGALRFLEEHEWFPDVVVGTSIGAVNGAAIASGHTAHSLWALWKKLRTEDVQQPNLGLLIDQSNSLLDTTPLRKTLAEGGWLDLERINHQPPAKHLRITVVEAQTGRLRVFGNSCNPSGKRSEHVPISVDHIVASCSIPIVYPPTTIGGTTFWDGGTVSNTPLGAAIDAGADDIVVVLMTPWEEETVQPRYAPVSGLQGLLLSAQAAFEWALLASFQADLKLFNRTNRLVHLQAENAALKAAAGEAQDEGEPGRVFREIPSPIIIAPQEPIPVADIIRYEPDNHVKLYEMGYLDARSAWARAGRRVE
jgi:NTE family protein